VNTYASPRTPDTYTLYLSPYLGFFKLQLVAP
jgi:hypothetical protein